MKYNRLGKTNLIVSELGLGTAQIGGPSLIKGKPFGAKPISDKDAYEILSLAKGAGINFFDSSDMYGDGLAEKRLGNFFNGADDVIFATKCGLDKNGNRRFDRPYVIETVEKSLKRLKRERIDLFQISKATLLNVKGDDLIETVLHLKKQGKIAYAGISIGAIEDGFGFIKQDVWDSFQIICNLLTLDFKELIDKVFEIDIGTIIRSPLSSGMLTGRFNENTRFPESDDRSVFMHGKLLKKRTNIVETIKKRFELTNEELIIFSLNFLLSDSKVSTIIPGATSSLQMKTNQKVINTERFPQEKLEEVYSFAKEIALKNIGSFQINY